MEVHMFGTEYGIFVNCAKGMGYLYLGRAANEEDGYALYQELQSDERAIESFYWHPLTVEN